MIATDGLMFEVGIIMLIAFIGAAVASKARQSVILGYILAGMLIGPFISVELFGYTYNGLVHDTGFVELLSSMGLTLLMFFVGLGFSMTKLKKTKAPAIILALMDVGLGMFLGILIGYALGWPIIDTIFLAGVISMSSVAITGKALEELERVSSPETEYLLGTVIVESFLSMVLLTIVGGLMFKSDADSMNMTRLVVGILAFYVFFIFLAILVVPRVTKYFERIKSNELFVLFALGLVFLSAALAEVAGVPAIIGAFFIGMVFAETKLAERIEDRITPFRDALVAVFFITFGMLIDLSMLYSIIPILLIAVPVSLFYEVIMLSSISYLLGFTSKAATFIGTAMTGRSSEAIMYASVGSASPAMTKGSELNPFAGAFCFLMSMVAPPLMKNSGKLTNALIKVLPKFLIYSGTLINRTMSKIILPSTIKLFERTRRLEVLVIIYFVDLVCIMVLPFPYNILAFVVGGLIVIVVYATLESDMYSIVRTVNYDNLGVVTRDPGHISRFISGFVSLSLVTILSLAALFALWWASSIIVLMVYLIIVMSMARSVYKVTRTPAFNISVKPVKRRTPRKKEKPFQPSFAAPDSRPDPGWDLETVAIERPSPAPMRRTDPGWELGPPDFEKVDERESFEPAKKRKPKDSAPVASESDEDKWGRL
ncbi:MAG TPA: cation:proton antiporter [Methanomassiliicoccales archaeon]|nr:cation:proton antiporter [Methanomassiliicoccales archaeon]HPR98394.1 cation:proton antiporter [Methanomassiliicoccales archaeon]